MSWFWSELSTSNYTKHGSRPGISGGWDHINPGYSMRINVDWVTAGSDWQNGSHGPSINVTWPSPRLKRHLFWKETLSIYRFHTTVTEPANRELTIEQKSQRYFDGFMSLSVAWRF